MHADDISSLQSRNVTSVAVMNSLVLLLPFNELQVCFFSKDRHELANQNWNLGSQVTVKEQFCCSLGAV